MADNNFKKQAHFVPNYEVKGSQAAQYSVGHSKILDLFRKGKINSIAEFAEQVKKLDQEKYVKTASLKPTNNKERKAYAYAKKHGIVIAEKEILDLPEPIDEVLTHRVLPAVWEINMQADKLQDFVLAKLEELGQSNPRNKAIYSSVNGQLASIGLDLGKVYKTIAEPALEKSSGYNEQSTGLNVSYADDKFSEYFKEKFENIKDFEKPTTEEKKAFFDSVDNGWKAKHESDAQDMGPHTDSITGGNADNKQPGNFNPQQLEKGIKVELEHTDDKSIAREIAMDHLVENPNYYDYLEDMEQQFD